MILTIIKKLLPFLDRFFPASKADELAAEAELEETRAFSNGRVSPKFFARYVCAGVFGLFALAVLIDACWPGLMPGAPLETLRVFSLSGLKLISAVLGN